MGAKGRSPDNAAAGGFGRQAGVLPQAKLPRCLDRRVRHVVGRVHGLVQGQAHQTRIRHEHHGQTHRTRARRLNARAIVANDHTDNEVQQNVTAPELVMGLLWGGRGTGEWLRVKASHQCELHACSFPHDVENFVDNLGISWV